LPAHATVGALPLTQGPAIQFDYLCLERDPNPVAVCGDDFGRITVRESVGDPLVECTLPLEAVTLLVSIRVEMDVRMVRFDEPMPRPTEQVAGSFVCLDDVTRPARGPSRCP
jgi:hypothetical protein